MIDLGVGTKINNRYTIVEKHGRGVLGTDVYIGRDEENGSEVLLRVIPPALSKDRETAERFLQGAELAGKLEHPNILPLLDAGEDNGILFLATPHEKGFFLNDYLEHRGNLDEKESVRIIKALADALHYAWDKQRIIHRDVSPDTIYVAKGNVPLLTDFEVAKSLDQGKALTMQGFAIGDPYYMSPEQAQGKDIDFRSDIYCLGLVFYQLLTGANPFADKPKMEALQAQVTEDPTPAQSKNPEISDACASVLAKMLVKDIEQRYQSWDSVVADLDALLKQRPPSTLTEDHEKPASGEYKIQAIHIPNDQTAKSAPPPTDTSETRTGDASAKNAKTPEADSPSFPIKPLAMVIVAAVIALIVIVLLVSTNRKGKDSIPPIAKQPSVSRQNVPATTPKMVVENVKNSPKVKAKPTHVENATAAAPLTNNAKTTPKELHNRQICLKNIKEISEALQMYANVFEGKFPKSSGAEGLNNLLKHKFIEKPQVFVCPSTGHAAAAQGAPLTENTCDYAYAGGLSTSSDGKNPILWSKPGNHKNFGAILYVNGEIKTFSDKDWESQLKSVQNSDTSPKN